jgi:hypothetical protein
MPTPAQILAAADFEPGCADRMEALGLPHPKTLGDVFRAQRDAYGAISEHEHQAYDRETRVALLYLASACKSGIGGPHRPSGMRYTA